MKSTIIWDITPCSPLKVNRRFEWTYPLHLQGRKISRARNKRESRWHFTLVSCSAYFSTLQMKAICSSKMLVDFQLATAEESGFNSWQGQEIFMLSTMSRLVLGPTQPYIQWVWGFLSLGKSGRGMKLIHQLHPVPRFCMEPWLHSLIRLRGVVLS
jgi:hypothetical protein